jgi:quinolinate synthase
MGAQHRRNHSVRFMKMNTLEKAYNALLNMEPELTLPESIRKRAELPICNA